MRYLAVQSVNGLSRVTMLLPIRRRKKKFKAAFPARAPAIPANLAPVLHPGRFKDAAQAAAYTSTTLSTSLGLGQSNTSPAPALKADLACLKPEMPLSAPNSIWLQLWPPVITPMSRRFICVYWQKENRKCRRLVPVCASWYISALVFSSIKPVIYLNLPKFKLSLLKTT
jgi:hypothetical protein